MISTEPSLSIDSSPRLQKVLARHKFYESAGSQWNYLARKTNPEDSPHWQHCRSTDLEWNYQIDRFSRYLWTHYKGERAKVLNAMRNRTFCSRTPPKFRDSSIGLSPGRRTRSTSIGDRLNLSSPIRDNSKVSFGVKFTMDDTYDSSTRSPVHKKMRNVSPTSKRKILDDLYLIYKANKNSQDNASSLVGTKVRITSAQLRDRRLQSPNAKKHGAPEDRLILEKFLASRNANISQQETLPVTSLDESNTQDINRHGYESLIESEMIHRQPRPHMQPEMLFQMSGRRSRNERKKAKGDGKDNEKDKMSLLSESIYSQQESEDIEFSKMSGSNILDMRQGVSTEGKSKERRSRRERLKQSARDDDITVFESNKDPDSLKFHIVSFSKLDEGETAKERENTNGSIICDDVPNKLEGDGFAITFKGFGFRSTKDLKAELEAETPKYFSARNETHNNYERQNQSMPDKIDSPRGGKDGEIGDNGPADYYQRKYYTPQIKHFSIGDSTDLQGYINALQGQGKSEGKKGHQSPKRDISFDEYLKNFNRKISLEKDLVAKDDKGQQNQGVGQSGDNDNQNQLRKNILSPQGVYRPPNVAQLFGTHLPIDESRTFIDTDKDAFSSVAKEDTKDNYVSNHNPVMPRSSQLDVDTNHYHSSQAASEQYQTESCGDVNENKGKREEKNQKEGNVRRNRFEQGKVTAYDAENSLNLEDSLEGESSKELRNFVELENKLFSGNNQQNLAPTQNEAGVDNKKESSSAYSRDGKGEVNVNEKFNEQVLQKNQDEETKDAENVVQKEGSRIIEDEKERAVEYSEEVFESEVVIELDKTAHKQETSKKSAPNSGASQEKKVTRNSKSPNQPKDGTSHYDHDIDETNEKDKDKDMNNEQLSSEQDHENGENLEQGSDEKGLKRRSTSNSSGHENKSKDNNKYNQKGLLGKKGQQFAQESDQNQNENGTQQKEISSNKKNRNQSEDMSSKSGKKPFSVQKGSKSNNEVDEEADNQSNKGRPTSLEKQYNQDKKGKEISGDMEAKKKGVSSNMKDKNQLKDSPKQRKNKNLDDEYERSENEGEMDNENQRTPSGNRKNHKQTQEVRGKSPKKSSPSQKGARANNEINEDSNNQNIKMRSTSLEGLNNLPKKTKEIDLSRVRHRNSASDASPDNQKSSILRRITKCDNEFNSEGENEEYNEEGSGEEELYNEGREGEDSQNDVKEELERTSPKKKGSQARGGKKYSQKAVGDLQQESDNEIQMNEVNSDELHSREKLDSYEEIYDQAENEEESPNEPYSEGQVGSDGMKNRKDSGDVSESGRDASLEQKEARSSKKKEKGGYKEKQDNQENNKEEDQEDVEYENSRGVSSGNKDGNRSNKLAQKEQKGQKLTPKKGEANKKSGDQSLSSKQGNSSSKKMLLETLNKEDDQSESDVQQIAPNSSKKNRNQSEDMSKSAKIMPNMQKVVRSTNEIEGKTGDNQGGMIKLSSLQKQNTPIRNREERKDESQNKSGSKYESKDKRKIDNKSSLSPLQKEAGSKKEIGKDKVSKGQLGSEEKIKVQNEKTPSPLKKNRNQSEDMSKSGKKPLPVKKESKSNTEIDENADDEDDKIRLTSIEKQAKSKQEGEEKEENKDTEFQQKAKTIKNKTQETETPKRGQNVSSTRNDKLTESNEKQKGVINLKEKSLAQGKSKEEVRKDISKSPQDDRKGGNQLKNDTKYGLRGSKSPLQKEIKLNKDNNRVKEREFRERSISQEVANPQGEHDYEGEEENEQQVQILSKKNRDQAQELSKLSAKKPSIQKASRYGNEEFDEEGETQNAQARVSSQENLYQSRKGKEGQEGSDKKKMVPGNTKNKNDQVETPKRSQNVSPMRVNDKQDSKGRLGSQEKTLSQSKSREVVQKAMNSPQNIGSANNTKGGYQSKADNKYEQKASRSPQPKDIKINKDIADFERDSRDNINSEDDNVYNQGEDENGSQDEIENQNQMTPSNKKNGLGRSGKKTSAVQKESRSSSTQNEEDNGNQYNNKQYTNKKGKDVQNEVDPRKKTTSGNVKPINDSVGKFAQDREASNDVENRENKKLSKSPEKRSNQARNVEKAKRASNDRKNKNEIRDSNNSSQSPSPVRSPKQMSQVIRAQDLKRRVDSQEKIAVQNRNDEEEEEVKIQQKSSNKEENKKQAKEISRFGQANSPKQRITSPSNQKKEVAEYQNNKKLSSAEKTREGAIRQVGSSPQQKSPSNMKKKADNTDKTNRGQNVSRMRAKEMNEYGDNEDYRGGLSYQERLSTQAGDREDMDSQLTSNDRRYLSRNSIRSGQKGPQSIVQKQSTPNKNVDKIDKDHKERSSSREEEVNVGENEYDEEEAESQQTPSKSKKNKNPTEETLKSSKKSSSPQKELKYTKEANEDSEAPNDRIKLSTLTKNREEIQNRALPQEKSSSPSLKNKFMVQEIPKRGQNTASKRGNELEESGNEEEYETQQIRNRGQKKSDIKSLQQTASPSKDNIKFGQKVSKSSLQKQSSTKKKSAQQKQERGRSSSQEEINDQEENGTVSGEDIENQVEVPAGYKDKRNQQEQTNKSVNKSPSTKQKESKYINEADEDVEAPNDRIKLSTLTKNKEDTENKPLSQDKTKSTGLKNKFMVQQIPKRGQNTTSKRANEASDSDNEQDYEIQQTRNKGEKKNEIKSSQQKASPSKEALKYGQKGSQSPLQKQSNGNEQSKITQKKEERERSSSQKGRYGEGENEYESGEEIELQLEAQSRSKNKKSQQEQINKSGKKPSTTQKGLGYNKEVVYEDFSDDQQQTASPLKDNAKYGQKGSQSTLQKQSSVNKKNKVIQQKEERERSNSQEGRYGEGENEYESGEEIQHQLEAQSGSKNKRSQQEQINKSGKNPSTTQKGLGYNKEVYEDFSDDQDNQARFKTPEKHYVEGKRGKDTKDTKNKTSSSNKRNKNYPDVYERESKDRSSSQEDEEERHNQGENEYESGQEVVYQPQKSSSQKKNREQSDHINKSGKKPSTTQKGSKYSDNIKEDIEERRHIKGRLDSQEEDEYYQTKNGKEVRNYPRETKADSQNNSRGLKKASSTREGDQYGEKEYYKSGSTSPKKLLSQNRYREEDQEAVEVQYSNHKKNRINENYPGRHRASQDNAVESEEEYVYYEKESPSKKEQRYHQRQAENLKTKGQKKENKDYGQIVGQILSLAQQLNRCQQENLQKREEEFTEEDGDFDSHNVKYSREQGKSPVRKNVQRKSEMRAINGAKKNIFDTEFTWKQLRALRRIEEKAATKIQHFWLSKTQRQIRKSKVNNQQNGDTGVPNDEFWALIEMMKKHEGLYRAMKDVLADTGDDVINLSIAFISAYCSLKAAGKMGS